jgi:hypothetical protein
MLNGDFLTNGIAVCGLEDRMMVAGVEAEELAADARSLLLWALSGAERGEAVLEKHELRVPLP